MHMYRYAYRRVPNAGRSDAPANRRGAARRRARGQRRRRSRRHPSIRCFAAPSYPAGGRIRARASRRNAAVLLAAARAVPGARRMGGCLSRPLGTPTRPVGRGLGTQTTNARARAQEEIVMSNAAKPSTRGHVTLERTFDAPIEDVWDLWTTKDGIESWWGPEGFRVEVR